MDLDHHAAEAAALLRDQVGGDLDPDAAYGQVLAGVGRRRARATGLRLGVAAIVALVTVGAVAVASTGGAGTDEAGVDRDPADVVQDGDLDESLTLDDGITPQGAAILGGLPDGPLDGKATQRLPVVADRADQLEEGDQVTLYGKGFEPGELVGAVHCSSEADVDSAGTDACDLGDANNAFGNTVTGNARYDGSVVITITVRRYITTPVLGPIDCASGPERCLFAIGAASDYDRSGGTYFQMAGAPRFADGTATIDPPGPYTAGQEVTVQGADLVPGRQYQAEQCAGPDHCAVLAAGRATSEGTWGATVAIGSSVEVKGEVVACGDDCTLQIRGVGLTEQTTAVPPPPFPLGPIGGEGAVATSPTTTAPAGPGSAGPIEEDPTGTVPPSTEVTSPSTELPPETEPPTTSTAPTTTTTG